MMRSLQTFCPATATTYWSYPAHPAQRFYEFTRQSSFITVVNTLHLANRTQLSSEVLMYKITRRAEEHISIVIYKQLIVFIRIA